MNRKKLLTVLYAVIALVALVACKVVFDVPVVMPSEDDQSAMPSPIPSPSATPPLTLDGFFPVAGIVAEVGNGYLLLQDGVSAAPVKLILSADTIYPDGKQPDFAVGDLLRGQTDSAWSKSLPPQTVLRQLDSIEQTIRLEGKILSVDDGTMLLEDKDHGQVALHFSEATLYAGGKKPALKAGNTVVAYAATMWAESYPPQAGLLFLMK